MKKWVVVVMLVAAVMMIAAPAGAQGKLWKIPKQFPTIQAAVDSASVKDGDTLMVGPGELAGALLTKSLTIKGVGRTSITSGPAHSSGLVMGFRLLAGSEGASIENLTFAVDLAIMNGAAVNHVTVTQNTFLNAVQAITNWRGSGWTITHNTITDLRTRNGGGIGILIGDYAGGFVSDNLIGHNVISGTLHVWGGDGGGYNGSGIVLYADFRWGRTGATAIQYNRVVKNKVGMVSDTPEVVDVAAIELTDSRDDETLAPVILNNAVGFNDLRGTTLQIVLTPTNLDQLNDISRNLGENRGHGLHPKAFGPGGNR